MCSNCKCEEKMSRKDFCKECNSINLKLKKYTNPIIKNKLSKLLQMRKYLNPEIKISSLDLEYLYNDLERMLGRNRTYDNSFHCAMQFDELSLETKRFLYNSISTLLYPYIKNLQNSNYLSTFGNNELEEKYIQYSCHN